MQQEQDASGIATCHLPTHPPTHLLLQAVHEVHHQHSDVAQAAASRPQVAAAGERGREGGMLVRRAEGSISKSRSRSRPGKSRSEPGTATMTMV